MKILEYLQKKYLAETPTTMRKAEAKIFGIEFPLKPGWLDVHGNREIDQSMRSRLLQSVADRGDRFSSRAMDALGASDVSAPVQDSPNQSGDFVVTEEWLLRFCTQKGAYSMQQMAALALTCDISKGWKKRIIGMSISADQRIAFEEESLSAQSKLKSRLNQQISLIPSIMARKSKIAKSARKNARALGIDPRTLAPIVAKPAAARQSTEQSVRSFISNHSKVDPTSDAFLSTFEWKATRMMALKKYGPVCQCCGATPSSGAIMHVDHIKPRKIFPQLALDIENLQVLCGDCNQGKGNWDMTDWRKESISS